MVLHTLAKSAGKGGTILNPVEQLPNFSPSLSKGASVVNESTGSNFEDSCCTIDVVGSGCSPFTSVCGDAKATLESLAFGPSLLVSASIPTLSLFAEDPVTASALFPVACIEKEVRK